MISQIYNVLKSIIVLRKAIFGILFYVSPAIRYKFCLVFDKLRLTNKSFSLLSGLNCKYSSNRFLFISVANNFRVICSTKAKVHNIYFLEVFGVFVVIIYVILFMLIAKTSNHRPLTFYLISTF